jgi:hypothetical protein
MVIAGLERLESLVTIEGVPGLDAHRPPRPDR